MLIDLHVHSNMSDGTLTPSEVIELAIDSNLSVLALTDHDTIDGIEEANSKVKDLKDKGINITLVPGVELSVTYKERDIHMLGLFVDTNNYRLKIALDEAKEKRERRNEKMASNFRKAGIPITVEKLKEYEEDAVITRAHFATYLVDNGYAKTNKEAFKKFLGKDNSFYVSREYFSPQEAIELIHDANGLAFIAHPLLYGMTIEELEEMVKDFAQMGIDGIEAIYSLNTKEEEEKMIELARKNKLLISGGTDFHGETKPHIKIGIGKGNMKIPYSIYEQIKEKKSTQR